MTLPKMLVAHGFRNCRPIQPQPLSSSLEAFCATDPRSTTFPSPGFTLPGAARSLDHLDAALQIPRSGSSFYFHSHSQQCIPLPPQCKYSSPQHHALAHSPTLPACFMSPFGLTTMLKSLCKPSWPAPGTADMVFHQLDRVLALTQSCPARL